jgi:HAD superfamily hydrolase (TIGR01549 family)
MKVVLFDMDHTLIDYPWNFFEEFTLDILDKYFGKRTDTRTAHEIVTEETDYFQKEGVDKEEFWRIYNELDPANRLAAVRRGDIKPMAGAVELLSELKQKNFRLNIVTATPEISGRPLLEGLGLLSYFNDISFKGKVYNKPHPEPALCILNKLNGMAKDVFFVGNSLDKDIACGRAVGAKTIHVKDNCVECTADNCVAGLNEVAKILIN